MAKSTWNIVKSIGPFLISQSDSMSEAFARHKMRLANVDASKEFLMQEIGTYTEIKKKLLKKDINADPEDRIRIRQNLDEISKSIRQLNIGVKALTYLPASTNGDSPSTTPPASTLSPEPEITMHWMDRFNELARSHNEEWREDLLARALAAESSKPGTVSTRVLWLIGTLEKDSFDAFATLLDLSSSIGTQILIPFPNKFISRPIPECILGLNVSIGNLLYSLEEIGLFGSLIGTSLTLPKGSLAIAIYGQTAFSIHCKDADLAIPGVIPSNLGKSLASFYQPKPNPLGREIFESWIATLNKEQYPVLPINYNFK
jgi:hypothetical protein